MKQIRDYTVDEVKKAYEGIKAGLVINSNQPVVISNLLVALETVKERANELGIILEK